MTSSGERAPSGGGPRRLELGETLAGALVLAPAGWAALLRWRAAELYSISVQEDGSLEWMTFWAFAIASGVFFALARGAFRSGAGFPWFELGLALFCGFVAMEEISWGQRLLGYRAPAYFLEHNFQQELNLHNVVETSWRKLALKAVLLGYGVVLPLAAAWPVLGRWLRRLGVRAPSLALVPGFFTAWALYVTYPWRFSGEVVELMLGAGFLFAAVLERGSVAKPGQRRAVLATAVAVLALGLATTALTAARTRADPAALEAARVEVEALARDFRELAERNGGDPVTGCGLHKRLYSYVEKYERRALEKGAFAALEARGLPAERAQFFIDPWNSPYWIRHHCSADRESQRVWVYSFGPNRARDSTREGPAGDDLEVLVWELPGSDRPGALP